MPLPSRLNAAEVVRRFELQLDGVALLQDGQSADEFVNALEAAEHYDDAMVFLAHCLPKRDAVWWGCLCCAQAYGEPLAPADEEAMSHAIRWVLHPGEPERRALEACSNRVDRKSALGALVFAGFYSGGSVLGPDLPVVQPPPGLTAHLVGVALQVAARQGPTEPYQRLFLRLGREVAAGKNRWG